MAIFTNQASVTLNGTVTRSNTVTGEIIEVLSAVKSALATSYDPNGAVGYALTLTNSGNFPLTDLTITDDLGAYTFNTLNLVPLTYEENSVELFVNGVLQPTPTVASTNPLTITGVTIPADSNALVLYRATANEYAPIGSGSIVNTATITGGTLSSPVEATSTLPASTGPILTITKALSPTTVNENGQITYTLTVNNIGNEAVQATDDAIITDTFNPVLSNIAVTYNSTPWTAPANYTYDETTGVFTTAPDQIMIDAAQYSQDIATGVWSVVPGTAVITITGTV